MAGYGLNRRVAELEECSGVKTRPWHRVTPERGQSEVEAVSQYETVHGPIGDGNVILRWFVSPGDDLKALPPVGLRERAGS